MNRNQRAKLHVLIVLLVLEVLKDDINNCTFAILTVLKWDSPVSRGYKVVLQKSLLQLSITRRITRALVRDFREMADSVAKKNITKLFAVFTILHRRKRPTFIPIASIVTPRHFERRMNRLFDI